MPTSLRKVSKAQGGKVVGESSALTPFGPGSFPYFGETINADTPQQSVIDTGGREDLKTITDFLEGHGDLQSALSAFNSLSTTPEGYEPNPLGSVYGQALLDEILKKGRPDTSAGGASSAFDFANLAENVRQFDKTFEFSRQSAVANTLADLIATEITRKGKRAELGGDLLEMFMNAIGLAAPSNLNVIPGYEKGGIAEKLAKGLGMDPEKSDLFKAARHPERATIPFAALDKQISDIKGVQDVGAELRNMVEALFPEISNPDTAAQVGTPTGGATVSPPASSSPSALPESFQTPDNIIGQSGSGPALSGGVSKGVASTVNKFLNSGLTPDTILGQKGDSLAKSEPFKYGFVADGAVDYVLTGKIPNEPGLHDTEDQERYLELMIPRMTITQLVKLRDKLFSSEIQNEVKNPNPPKGPLLKGATFFGVPLYNTKHYENNKKRYDVVKRIVLQEINSRTNKAKK